MRETMKDADRSQKAPELPSDDAPSDGDDASAKCSVPLDETAYLLRSPRNAERLLEAIASLDRGEGVERALLR